MPDTEQSVQDLIPAARSDRGALGKLLEKYRPYLLIVSRCQINRKVAVRCSPSDIVQETILEALAGFDDFKGADEAQLTAWIGTIHQRQLDGAARRHLIAKRRSVDRELRLQHQDGSAILSWRDVAATSPTPSDRIVSGERALRLAELLADLPDQQSEAICLRHLEGLPIAQIADQMDRSMQSVAGLLKRGLKSLRTRVSEASWL